MPGDECKNEQPVAWAVSRKLAEGRTLRRETVTNKGLPLTIKIREGAFDYERFPEDDGEMYVVTAFSNGEFAGFADYYSWGSVENVKVEPGFRRKGVATAIYDFLDSIGFHTDPSTHWMEPEGKAFWEQRKRARR